MKKRSRKNALSKPRKPGKSPYKRVVEFPQARGRTVEMIELIADTDYHCVSIRFQDKIDLDVMIDPALTFAAGLYDWKSGEQRVLKRWPRVRSDVP